METTSRYDTAAATTGAGAADYSSTTLAAAFTERESAHDAVHRLHDEGFRETWIGLTRSADKDGYAADNYSNEVSASSPAATPETRVESENWFTRFFGEGDESLHDALVRHGVTEADASTAGSLPAHDAILTVDGGNHPELAAQIISESGGQLITRGFGATGYGTQGTYGFKGTDLPATGAIGTAPAAYDELADTSLSTGVVTPPIHAQTATPRTTSLVEDGGSADVRAYDDYGRYRAGKDVDESTRLQLREERLRIDKSFVSRGEATIGKELVTEKHEIDVPLVREELFIERRPASGSATGTIGDIGQSEVIRVPLSEERVSVTKVPVVTEEVVVGKRQVEETQHISETTRKEELTVADIDPLSAKPVRG